MQMGFNGQWRFLSNFYASEIDFEGLTYPTVEHAYQAAKTEDPEVRRFLSLAVSPSLVKSLGRKLVLREDWEDVKLPIMDTLIRKKFYDETLKKMLLATGDADLVEYNYWHDQFWGDCQCNRHARTQGANHLGRILMAERANLLERVVS